MVLDPMFTAIERTDRITGSNVFGHRFGIQFQSNKKFWYVREITSKELFTLYYIKVIMDAVFPTNLYPLLDDILPYSIPW